MARRKTGDRLFRGLCAVALAASIASAGKAATPETVLQRFPNRTNGVEPGGLILGPAGALYGTTFTYGPGRAGTVFRLTPPAAGHGAWTLDTLYAFHDHVAGAYPAGDLITDKSGAIYGTTMSGGKNFTGKNQGRGVVFKLSPPAKSGGAWTESVLFSFTKNQDGPSGLAMDNQGALYGASYLGGRKGLGTIFKLTPPAKGEGEWSVTTIYAFQGKDGLPLYGSSPDGLILGQDGALYGTTADTGSAALPQAGNGSVFRLTPPANGQSDWTFTTLHAFSGGTDGAGPGALVLGPLGAVYGVSSGATGFGTSSGNPTVFRLTPPAAGKTGWTNTTLYTFTDNDSGSGLALSKTGSLFGTTWLGGTLNSISYGTVFRLDPTTTGRTAWTKRTLYSFQEGKDGALPGGLLIDPAGTLYGTTTSGGGGQCRFDFEGGFSVMGCGTVYQLTP
jgi:uncharacterized repeat protein (TIGR03803 family)